ncbi:GNAT family N-acetyltransferase [Dactylosporangium sp. CS-047395]|uniref:GNAT family N-acetyltransferase n=1 Tax=Dactylosporangium sp. CS-047395 TaxID=3239936 RepID=UPI003D8C8134
MDHHELILRRHDAAAALGMRAGIEPVYVASHADRIAVDPFSHPDRFWQRLVDMYAQAPGFVLVSGSIAGRLIGYGFGCTRSAERAAEIWSEIRAALPDLAIPAGPQPVFIFNEFAVHPGHQNRGYGRTILDALLAGRREPVANLFVRPENPARAHYLAWGWRKIAERKPFADSPTFDSLIKDLRVTANWTRAAAGSGGDGPGSDQVDGAPPAVQDSTGVEAFPPARKPKVVDPPAGSVAL